MAALPLYHAFTTQAQIDAQYNPSLGLADATAPGRHYVALAERARASLPHTADVAYGPTLAETLDIFPAAPRSDGRPAPVFVFLHGGYWRALSSKEFSGVALGLHARGITTVVVNYALCPAVTIDEITRQCRAAVAWVLRQIQHHGGDPARVALGGHSAGGHLTAMCLQTRWAEDYGLPADPLAGAVLISGLYDLAPLRYSCLQPAIQLDDGTIRRQSPAFAVRPCATPVWVTWGGAESTEFARQSATYHQAWQAAGNTGTLAPIDGADHFTVLHGLAEADSALCDWIARALGEPAA
jgi:arylformamidase